ncbi:hypothetical protein M9Y10_006679 [Tritrichomonas musculus]|uniref:Uncharacterized protein n=1 Tax=Tritrichomonas musculus TaxID=1915356 RepID=A0ABR2JES9_9EUKA
MDNNNNNFPIFDRNNTEIITSYAEPISATNFVYSLVNSFDSQDESHPNEPKLKIPLLAESIEGFNLLLEQNLYQIENTIDDSNVSIQTLPHHTGNDHELISVIQPTAWILKDAGCYYDPVERRIMKNCVGHWDGQANSISNHIYQTITNGCFMSYHIIVLFSILAAILMFCLTNQSTFSILLIVIVSVGYDLIAILFIIFVETCAPYSGNPTLANKIQNEVSFTVNNTLQQLVNSIPAQVLELICSGKKMTISEITGTFILRYFYEPAVTMLSQSLKLSSTAMYNKTKAKQLKWNEIENLLVVYRFTREISETVYLGTDEIQLDNSLILNLRLLLIALIEDGDETVHMQLLRLLYKSAIKPDERGRIILHNHNDLSLNHYIGSAECETIRIQLRKDISRPRSAAQKNNPAIDVRWANISKAIDPYHMLSTSTSFSRT